MRAPVLALSLLLIGGSASAQDYRGGESDNPVVVDMGSGLDNGIGVGFRFREHWTIRPTIGLGYSAQRGFQGNIGSTLMRSFGIGNRVYWYAGAGVYYGTANGGMVMTGNGPVQTSGGGSISQSNSAYGQVNNSALFYVTAPVGIRARVFRNIELFAEGAYQRRLAGEFGRDARGQISGDAQQRIGATIGLSLLIQ